MYRESQLLLFFLSNFQNSQRIEIHTYVGITLGIVGMYLLYFYILLTHNFVDLP